MLSEALSLGGFNNELYTDDYETYSIDKLFFEHVEKGNSVVISPNPFTETTTMKIYSSESQRADLRRYDINGKEVYNRTNLILSSGANKISLDSSELSARPGMYIYSLQVGGKNIQ